MKRIALVGCVVVAAVAAVGVAYAGQSPKALRASILAAAKSQHSVHWDATEVEGNIALTTGVDAGKSAGEQHVKWVLGKKQSAHITIRVVPGTAYVRGDSIGLQLNLGLTDAQAKHYADHWIAIPRADKLYGPVAQADTLGSLIQTIAPHGNLSIYKDTRHKNDIGVQGVSGAGKKKKAQVLITRTSGKPLPIEADQIVPAHAFGAHMVFSKWNEPVNVQAPATATPIATVRGS